MHDVSPRRTRIFAITAWTTLAFNVLVILGGAVVRATGSGDGCGESWPKCGDQIIPPNPTVETAIEFSHRVSSFLAGVGVATVVVLALRFFPKGHIVRKAAVVAGVFLIIEALLGAALVLYGWVDDDVSLGRTIVVPLHLANTFLLLGAITLTAWWGSGNPAPTTGWGSSRTRWVLLGAAVLIVLGATGALNALADTIFPSDTVTGDLTAKFGPTAPLLSRLRIVHPVISVVGGMFVAWIATRESRTSPEATRRAASLVTLIVLSQMFIGIANIFFLTPIALQLLHLAVADLLWIAFVVFGASLLGDPVRATTDRRVPV
jgi:heme A synthase